MQGQHNMPQQKNRSHQIKELVRQNHEVNNDRMNAARQNDELRIGQHIAPSHTVFCGGKIHRSENMLSFVVFYL